VLVADDEPTMLELVAHHLKQHENPRLEILEATDGEEAWKLARERLPDLVVLDVMMPGMSGWEVCRKIREDVALAHTSVVMLTGIGENLNQMTSPLYGADAYLDKPFEFHELDAKVEQALLARAALRGSIARPAVNGVTGPAKVAPEATRDAAPKRKAAAKAKAKAAKPAPKKSAAKPAATKKAAPAKKAAKKAVKKAAPKKAVKKAAPKKTVKKSAPKKKAAAKKRASKKKR
jgi:DNA-binding response OmpR family regulator